jgi:trimeric autotransporter adhesin
VINGSNFTSGPSFAASFGAGVVVNSTTFVDASHLSANITIPPGASTGGRTVTVTNGDGGVGRLASAFTVRAAPTVTAMTPTSADIGATNYNVAITGSGFVSGAIASLGPNVTVKSTTVNSATKVTATITIPAGASTGPTNVTVTNLDGSSAIGAGLFTVNGAPTITSPSTAQPQIVTHSTKATFSITGTNFESSAKVTISGGFGSPSVTFVSPTQLNVTVTASTTRGTYDLTVTNPDGTKVVSTGAMVNQ